MERWLKEQARNDERVTRLQTHPGVGLLTSLCLVHTLGELARFSSTRKVAAYVGFDPVEHSSAERKVYGSISKAGSRLLRIRWRYFCPKFFRQSFHEYAAESIHHSFWARAYYAMQRTKGKGHHAAVRALCFKWIRIIWKCWQTRTPYNEVIYLESLRKKGSSLLNFAANNPN